MEKPAKSKTPAAPQITEAALLDVVRRLVQELYPGRSFGAPISLDSALDKELGFDSLGRMELLLRLERNFHISLPEKLFVTAETPRALLDAALIAGPEQPHLKPGAREIITEAEGKAISIPEQAETLQEVLAWHVEHHEERTHIYLYEEGDQAKQISYGALYRGALAVAAGLRERGLEPRQTVALMLPTSRDYFFGFFGILLAGGVPAPIYPPTRPSQIEDHLQRHARILSNAEAVLLLTIPEAKPVARLLKSQVDTLRHITTVAELTQATIGAGTTPEPALPEDLAFLQYTSGSTGNPKGVMLTHHNLLANLRAMGKAVNASSDDTFISWLPLYHDMGLIGAWFGSLYFAFPLVAMSPLAFLARPQRWLWAIHNHHGTLSAAPNFAYELCLSKLEQSDLEGLDLSSWRMAFNGAEPVSPNTVRRFSEQFSQYGLHPDTMAPVYGLAESSVGLAFPPPGRITPVDRIQRETLELSGKAVPAEVDDDQALEFVACGRVLDGHALRVVDPKGRELPDRRQGHLQFRGPSCTRGYIRNPEATNGLFDGDWLDSGDLAYLAEEDLYITSRVKDLIIRAGRNLYPYEVEEAVGDIPGVRKGCVAMFGATDSTTATERVVVVAESRETDHACLDLLKQQVQTVATELLDMPPDEVVMAPPHTVLKTSSGKIRRSACKELFEKGKLDQTHRPVWQQFARVGMATIAPTWRRFWRALPNTLYGLYAWLMLLILAPPVWLLIAVLPPLSWRWVLMRNGARLLALLTGTGIKVSGAENLPKDRPCILASNHASYLDGIIIVAALPIKWRFVAKVELLTNFIPRIFLKSIGSEFVERFDRQKGIEDAQRLAETAGAELPLFYFPEGTFREAPGLLPFRMGAFTNAAAVGIPVVPIIISGSRRKLRGHSWLPLPGDIEIRVEAAIEPEGSDWDAAIKLRDATRGVMLGVCGEPDRSA
jgi:1-acyl-sn-glycerol-3-phosphate acyltransferase